ncbi:hypothetical protein FQA39_LY03340 [Lamprigera yunnana]|nr:hypothetical protein FQA39_LY03340 [Lamprigera yunnana]
MAIHSQTLLGNLIIRIQRVFQREFSVGDRPDTYIMWTSYSKALKDVSVIVPQAVVVGDSVSLHCRFNLEGEPLYTVKWYKGQSEFYRYLPKELPNTQVFPLSGIAVDLSNSSPNKVVLQDVQTTTTGRYRCEVSTDAPNFYTNIETGYIECSKKRKRTKNTSNEQMELYLQAMENDYVLRSNTINPTFPPNYIQEKWEELTLQLNGIGGDGPVLTSEEWKKRFVDWKYATKAKYRKINTHRTGTGGGPRITISLTQFEERGLDVWGRVTVQGMTTVTQYEGIPTTADQQENLYVQANPASSTYEVEPADVDNLVTFVQCGQVSDNNEENPPRPSHSNTETYSRPSRVRPKPLSILAESLLQNTDTNVTQQTEFLQIFKKFTEGYISIEEETLEFEIKKFKFLNPNFKE